MKYNNILIDVNNLYSRAYNGFSERTVQHKGKAIQTHGIEGSLLMILKIQTRFLTQGGTTYFLFDNPTSRDRQRRYIDPGYKSNRDHLPPSYFRGLDYLELVLKNWQDDTFIIRQQNTEADDWTRVVIENNRKDDKETFLLVSRDLDWARDICGTVHWLDKDTVYSPDSFEDNYGFYPYMESVCFYKTFYGDPADNIKPGLKQLPRSAFREISRECETIWDFMEGVEERRWTWVDAGWQMRVRRDRDLLSSNWKLVTFYPLTQADLTRRTLKCSFKESKLRILYTIFELSMDKRVGSFETKPAIDALLSGEKLERK